MTNPRRGEIWLVQLDPTRGQEIQKTRPAVVISSEIFSNRSGGLKVTQLGNAALDLAVPGTGY